jgi:Kef-type K+ transport system membrane component KefB
MKINISITEIFLLSIFFTVLAIYFDIHRENNVLSFILNHVIALFLSLIISKIIFHFIATKME